MNFKIAAPQEKDWLETVHKQSGGKELSILHTVTDESIIIKPIYKTNPNITYLLSKKNPVLVAPFLFANNNNFNLVARDALAKGQTALSIDLDLLSQFGYNSHTMAPLTGQVHLTEYEHFDNLFGEIDLNTVPLFFNAYNTFPGLFEIISKYVGDKGFEKDKVKGSLGADPLGAPLVYGGFPEKVQDILSKLASVYKIKKDLPNLDMISISADIIHNSGGHAVDELSYILSSVAEYMRLLMTLGVASDNILSGMRVTLAVGNDQFKEIAKIRALKILWQRLCEIYGQRSIPVKIDAQSSWRLLSSNDVHTNILRHSGQAFSALIGGCDSINIFPFDLSVKATNEFSRRQARNTAIILMKECHLDKVTDPAAGSGFLDSLTYELAVRSWQIFQKIEGKGGLLHNIRSGGLQNSVMKNDHQQRINFAAGLKKAIGVNCYKLDDDIISSDRIIESTLMAAQYQEKITPLNFNKIYEELADEQS